MWCRWKERRASSQGAVVNSLVVQLSEGHRRAEPSSGEGDPEQQKCSDPLTSITCTARGHTGAVSVPTSLHEGGLPGALSLGVTCLRAHHEDN